MGKQNHLADLLSCKEIKSREWVLKSSVMNSLFALWGQPMIDPFLTQENKKAMLLCSWILSRHTFCAGCPICCMGEHVCICIPSNSTYSQSTLSHETVPVYCNPDSALLAVSAVVSNSSQSTDSKSCQTSMLSRSSISESGGGVTPRTRDV